MILKTSVSDISAKVVIVDIDEVLMEKVIWAMIASALQHAPRYSVIDIKGSKIPKFNDDNNIIDIPLEIEYIYRIDVIINDVPNNGLKVIIIS